MKYFFVNDVNVYNVSCGVCIEHCPVVVNVLQNNMLYKNTPHDVITVIAPKDAVVKQAENIRSICENNCNVSQYHPRYRHFCVENLKTKQK